MFSKSILENAHTRLEYMIPTTRPSRLARAFSLDERANYAALIGERAALLLTRAGHTQRVLWPESANPCRINIRC